MPRLTDERLKNVVSRDGRAALDHVLSAAEQNNWHLICGGTAVPHVQFRREKGQRPYPFSLLLNTNVPTFYVRRPTKGEQQTLLKDFAGAHLNPSGEVKVPVPDKQSAARVVLRFLA